MGVGWANSGLTDLFEYHYKKLVYKTKQMKKEQLSLGEIKYIKYDYSITKNK